MARIYISSTFEDLKEQREEVHRVLRRQGHVVVCMEDYVARDERSLERCVSDVRESELYVGLFAFRYGYVPPEQPDGGTRSITELEYRAASDAGKERLCFLLDKSAPWPPDFVDEDRGSVKRLRAELEHDHASGSFRSTEQLCTLVLEAVTDWERRTGHQPQRKAQSTALNVDGYARKVAERYGRIDLDALIPPERDEQFRIPLDAVYVEQDVREDSPPVELPKELWEKLQQAGEVDEKDVPKGVTPELIQRARAAFRERPTAKLFDALSRPDERHVVLLGDPGAGKSTLTRYVLLSLLNPGGDERVHAAYGSALPLLVELRKYAGLRAEGRCETFVDYFDFLGRTEGFCLDARALTTHLQAKAPILVIFDGLDELFDPRSRETVTHQIAGFVSDYPDAHVLVTSRVVGYAPGALTDAGFAHFTLQDLKRQQVEQFLGAWFARVLGDRPEDSALRKKRILAAVDESRSIAQIAGNPMLLTIMAIIGKNQELPRERTEFYQHAASVLVEHWDVRKHLVDMGMAPGQIDKHEKFDLLRRIAWAMQTAPGGLAGNYIDSERLLDVIGNYLAERFVEAPARAKLIANEIVRQLRERNFILCLYGAGIYGFVHRSFLEFFCATAIQYRFEKTRELSLEGLRDEIYGEHWEKPEWREVLRLVAGLVEPKFAGEVIDHLASAVDVDWPADTGDRSPRNLTLAVECLGEVRNLLQLEQTGERLLARLIALLERCNYDEDDIRYWWVMEEIAESVEAIGESWPGRMSAQPWFLTHGPELAHEPIAIAWCHIMASLYRSDPKVLALLVSLLIDDDERLRIAAAEALIANYRGHDGAFEMLVDLLRNDKEHDRSAIVEVLGAGFRERSETLELLIDCVRKDPEALVRRASVVALAAR